MGQKSRIMHKACMCGKMLTVLTPPPDILITHRCICGRHVDFVGPAERKFDYKHLKIKKPKIIG